MASVGRIRTCKSELLYHLAIEQVPPPRRAHGVPRRWPYHFEPRFLTRFMCWTLRISPEERWLCQDYQSEERKGRQVSPATLRGSLPARARREAQHGALSHLRHQRAGLTHVSFTFKLSTSASVVNPASQTSTNRASPPSPPAAKEMNLAFLEPLTWH